MHKCSICSCAVFDIDVHYQWHKDIGGLLSYLMGGSIDD